MASGPAGAGGGGVTVSQIIATMRPPGANRPGFCLDAADREGTTSSKLSILMQLIIDKNTGAKKRKKRPLQARFDKLSERLSRKRQQQERFRKTIDELTEMSSRLNTEHDRKQLKILIALAERLTTFAGRKSLSDWHREELAAWMRELIAMRIAPLDPQTARRLSDQYEETLAVSLLGMTREEVTEWVRAQEEEVAARQEQEPEKEASGDAEFEELLQDDLFGFDDIPGDDDSDDGFDDPFAETGERDRQTEPLSINQSAWLKRLFRRTAQALHPDRETDPERQRQKLAKMKGLLRARKENDVMGMLALYSEAIGETDISITEGEMHRLCELLQQQIDALEFEKFQYVESHPERSFAHAVLYHHSSKQRARLLQEWCAEMENEAENNRQLLADLRNLTALKAVLCERRDRRRDILLRNLADDIGRAPW